MTRHRFHQRRHLRRSGRGRLYVAGRRQALPMPPVPKAAQQAVLQAEHETLIHDLKAHKRARIPDIGVLRLVIRPATRGGKHMIAFGKPIVTTPKPDKKIVRFRAAQALLEAVQ